MTPRDGSDSGAYLTIVEVADLARCEHKAVRRAIDTGRLRASKPVAKWLIREDDARAWIEGRPIASPMPRRREPRAQTRSQRAGSVARLRAIGGEQ